MNLDHPIRVLVVDDESDLGDLAISFLGKFEAMEADAVTSVPEARVALARHHYDAIVSDYQMPDEDGILFLKSLRRANDRIPFILLTGKGREEIVIEALNSGADAYLQKGGAPKAQFAELAHKIRLTVKARRNEQERRLVETRLFTLIHAIPDLVWMKDEAGTYLSCNTVFERLFGAREEEIVGRTDYDFVEKEAADSFREHDRKAMAACKPTSNEEWITYKNDGHRALLETTKTPVYGTNGTLIGVLGIGRDITLRKQHEEELKTLATHLLHA